MNYLKMQTDILKAWEKENTRGIKSPWMYSTTDTTVCVSEGYFVMVIPACAFALDIAKVFPNRRPINIGDFIKNADYADLAYDTGITRTVDSDYGRKVRVIKTEKGEDVWINEDYLKYFGKDVTSFRATDKKKPVYLYEMEVLVGIILPVNHA